MATFDSVGPFEIVSCCPAEGLADQSRVNVPHPGGRDASVGPHVSPAEAANVRVSFDSHEGLYRSTFCPLAREAQSETATPRSREPAPLFRLRRLPDIFSRDGLPHGSVYK